MTSNDKNLRLACVLPWTQHSENKFTSKFSSNRNVGQKFQNRDISVSFETGHVQTNTKRKPFPRKGTTIQHY